MNLPFHSHAKYSVIEETGYDKIPINLFDNEACLYNFESPLTSSILIG